jgi:hypothetical protein
MAYTYETSISHVTEGDIKDEYVHIESSEPTVISALLRKPAFEVVSEDSTPGFPRLVRFRIPVNDVNWGALARRKGTPRPQAHLNLRPDSQTESTVNQKSA